MTTIGAAMVFFMKRQSSALMQQIFLGFASGVMIAASIWSLLIPAIDEAAQNGQPGWIPAAGGFILGLVLMLTLDGLMPHLHSGAEQAEGLPSSFRRTTLLVLAVTLHNIPEVMPWLLSAAAGAMLYVVVEELIPEAHLGEHSHPGTLGVMAGFLVMMVLDTALG